MKIVSMTASTRMQDRYYAKLENGETLKVNTAHIADYSLFTGRELSDEEFAELVRDTNRAQAKSRALRMVSSRPMSEQEVSDRLRAKGVAEEDAKDAVELLQRIGAVNDEEYAGMIVRHYSAKGYGLSRIKNELFRRGVPRKLWDGALAQMPDSDAVLDQLIGSKLSSRTVDRKEIKKITDMLCRRGFSWEEIRSALARAELQTGETADD